MVKLCGGNQLEKTICETFDIGSWHPSGIENFSNLLSFVIDLINDQDIVITIDGIKIEASVEGNLGSLIWKIINSGTLEGTPFHIKRSLQNIVEEAPNEEFELDLKIKNIGDLAVEIDMNGNMPFRKLAQLQSLYSGLIKVSVDQFFEKKVKSL